MIGQRPPRFVIRSAVAMLIAAMVLSSCKRRPRDELAAQLSTEQAAKPPPPLPPLTLTDETPELTLMWLDAKGDVHEVHKPADVPTEGRDQVRVLVGTREEGTGDRFYVTNLTVKNPDGTYPVTTMTRPDWEDLLGKRRETFLKQRAAAANPEPAPGESAPPAGSTAPAGAVTVIVYGASWCEACHQAVAHLKRRRVPVIEKDIERDPGAENEMRDKLAKAGVRSGSIPIIDVNGHILVGFEPHALDQAIAGAASIPL